MRGPHRKLIESRNVGGLVQPRGSPLTLECAAAAGCGGCGGKVQGPSGGAMVVASGRWSSCDVRCPPSLPPPGISSSLSLRHQGRPRLLPLPPPLPLAAAAAAALGSETPCRPSCVQPIISIYKRLAITGSWCLWEEEEEEEGTDGQLKGRCVSVEGGGAV